MKHLFMGGKGQVGKALIEVFRPFYETGVLDLDGDVLGDWDILHVSIPYSDTFVESVKGAVEKYKVKLVINHSSVAVGTTRKIGNNAVHSPVRGQHDDLEKSLFRFVKYIGGVTEEASFAVRDIYKKVGIDFRILKNSETSELLKLLCLARYINDLYFYKKAGELLNTFGIEESAYHDWTKTYNDGYRQTAYPRSDLDFPKGKLGGHCVGVVPKILAEQFDLGWLKSIINEFDGN